MTEVVDKVTRFSSELVDAAAAEGQREHRSARQQLEHWARVGREVSNQRQVARQRVEAALGGRIPLSVLSAEESAVFNAEIAATLEESIATGNHVADRAFRGAQRFRSTSTAGLSSICPTVRRSSCETSRSCRRTERGRQIDVRRAASSATAFGQRLRQRGCDR